MKKSVITAKSAICVILGNLGQAVAFDCFLAGNDIAAGGFGGLALVISELVPLTPGVIVAIMSVPLFIWSWVVQGTKYTISALLSTAAFSFFVDALAFMDTLTEDRLLASLCGGFLYGISAYIMARGYVAGSGTDLLARLLVTKLKHISLGTLLLVCDGTVVVLSMIVFRELESGIYAVVTLTVMSFVLDAAINGGNKAMLFEIITDRSPDELSDAIMNEMERGVTLVPVTGMYERQNRNMLMVVVSPREVYAVKKLIRQHCPGAFVVMLPASEILGEGFSGLDVTVTERAREKENEQ